MPASKLRSSTSIAAFSSAIEPNVIVPMQISDTTMPLRPRRLRFMNGPCVSGSLVAIPRQELVAVGIAQVREIRLIAKARRVFAGHPAVRNACGMKRSALLRRLHGESDRAAVRVRGGFPVDRRRDTEHARGAAIEIPVLVRYTRADAERAE